MPGEPFFIYRVAKRWMHSILAQREGIILSRAIDGRVLEDGSPFVELFRRFPR
jgi:hypothetical protein